MKSSKVFLLAVLGTILFSLLTYPKIYYPNQIDNVIFPDSANGYKGPYTNTPVNNTISVPIDTISDNPGVDEINNLFELATYKGHDPFKIVALVASKKNKSLVGLEQFIFKNTITKHKSSKDTTVVINANKQLAIHALDAINSVLSQALLMKIVNTYPDINISGLALKKLASNVYFGIKNNNLSDKNSLITPDKEIVHLLLNNADDTTYVQSCNEPLGKIAREGITNWTGLDFGDLPVNTGNSKLNGMTNNLKDIREKWWQNNSNKIKWNKDKERFDLN